MAPFGNGARVTPNAIWGPLETGQRTMLPMPAITITISLHRIVCQQVKSQEMSPAFVLTEIFA